MEPKKSKEKPSPTRASPRSPSSADSDDKSKSLTYKIFNEGTVFKHCTDLNLFDSQSQQLPWPIGPHRRMLRSPDPSTLVRSSQSNPNPYGLNVVSHTFFPVVVSTGCNSTKRDPKEFGEPFGSNETMFQRSNCWLNADSTCKFLTHDLLFQVSTGYDQVRTKKCRYHQTEAVT
jgi:hypothetical protein